MKRVTLEEIQIRLNFQTRLQSMMMTKSSKVEYREL